MKSVNHHQLGKLIKEAFKKKRPLFIWGGIGIGKCLDGNTPITTDNGIVKLKNVGVEDRVLCYDFKNSCIKYSSVLNIFIKPKNKTTIKIETDNGQTIISSKEHHFLVKNKWVKAKDLKIGDIVYSHGKSRIALSGRDNRRGRFNNDNNRQTIQQKIQHKNGSFSSFNSNKQLITGVNGMVKTKFQIKKSYVNQRQKASQNNISSTNSGSQKCISNFKTTISNINSKKEASRNNNEIYRNEKRQIYNGEKYREKLYERRNSLILGIKKSELYPIRITKIYRKNEKEMVLYDITTEFGNYFANGILVHNSDSVRNVAKQIAKDKNLIYNEDISKINDKGNFSVIDIRASQMDISDIKGLPKFDEENKTTKWYYPNYLPKDKDSQGILFFDEINTASPMVQSNLYSLILDRRVAEYCLPPNWIIISAGNKISDRSNVFETPAPLNNRFIHIELEVPDVDSWIEWAVKNKIDTRISTFLKFKPVLYKFDSKVNEKSFPSPRTWQFCSEMISDKETRDLDTINILVASCVGEATAIEFTAWLKLSEKIDIEEILKNPLEAKLPREIDMTYAMISGILEHYKKDRKLMKPIVQLATRLTPEFAVMMLKLVKTHNTRFVEEVVNLPEWKKDLAKKLQPYFKEETD